MSLVGKIYGPRPMVWWHFHVRNIVWPYHQAMNSLKHVIFAPQKWLKLEDFLLSEFGGKKSLYFRWVIWISGRDRDGRLYCMCMVDFFWNIYFNQTPDSFLNMQFPQFTGCIYYDRPVRPWEMLIQSNTIQPATSYRKTVPLSSWNQQLNKRWYFILLRNSTRMCKKYIHSFGISIPCI